MESVRISGIKISVYDLMPHPDNPRKNVGDVSELSESIKKNGIMQNLTVMPEECLTKEPEDQPNIKKESSKKYYVLIGHRRLEAAKKAGLREVPCTVISNISKKQQVGIMLEENMQRHDLTVWEQASGFQMMLDLGSSVDEIVEKTGFSKTTVYHRLNIAKLKKNVVEEKEQDPEFQLSIGDLIELEKVRSVTMRNKILKESWDSRNMRGRISRAVREEKINENLKKVKKFLKKNDIKESKRFFHSYDDDMEKVKEIDLSKDLPEEIKIKKSKDKLWWSKDIYSDNLYIFKIVKKGEKKKSPEELKRLERERNRKNLNKARKQMIKERKEFVRDIILHKFEGIEGTVEQIEKLWNILRANEACIGNGCARLIIGGDYWGLSAEERGAVNKQIEELSMFEQMMAIAVCQENEYIDWNCRYKEEKGKLEKMIYEFLYQTGFRLTDDQEAILNGTHELYEQEKR